MDDETLAYIRERVADETQLPNGWGERLQGETLAELRADARVMAKDLGLAVDDERDAQRDEHGRFARSGNRGSMNSIIRQASGRR